MQPRTSLKNCERLFIGEDRQLSLDPRRWARVFRADQTNAFEAIKNPAVASRKTVRQIKAVNKRRAALTIGSKA